MICSRARGGIAACGADCDPGGSGAVRCVTAGRGVGAAVAAARGVAAAGAGAAGRIAAVGIDGDPGRAVEGGVAADPFAGRAAIGAGAGFSRSPTLGGWRGAGSGAGFVAVFGDGTAGLAAARGVADADVGVSRSPTVGIAGRGDGVADCAVGLSAARAAAGRKVGAGRSLPSGGGLDSVTAGCPLLQAASSTLGESPAQRKAMFADSARSAQCWGGGKSTSGSQASEEQIWRNGDPLPIAPRLRNTSDALVPPNPNELDSAILIGRFCALCAHEVDRGRDRRIVEIDGRRHDLIAHRRAGRRSPRPLRRRRADARSRIWSTTSRCGRRHCRQRARPP